MGIFGIAGLSISSDIVHFFLISIGREKTLSLAEPDDHNRHPALGCQVSKSECPRAAVGHFLDQRTISPYHNMRGDHFLSRGTLLEFRFDNLSKGNY